jgi:hypothetical protein
MKKIVSRIQQQVQEAIDKDRLAQEFNAAAAASQMVTDAIRER